MVSKSPACRGAPARKPAWPRLGAHSPSPRHKRAPSAPLARDSGNAPAGPALCPLDVSVLKHRSIVRGSGIYKKRTRGGPRTAVISLRLFCLRKRVLSAAAGGKRHRSAQFHLEFRELTLTLFPG